MGLKTIIAALSRNLTGEPSTSCVFRGPGGKAARRADTQYRDVIIKFERDIKAPAKLRHAKASCKTTFAANYNAGRRDDFRLIATDGVRWHVYGVAADSYLDKKKLISEEVVLRPTESFDLAALLPVAATQPQPEEEEGN